MPDVENFDSTRALAMAAFGTLRGFRRHAADPVTIVEEPLRPGEVTLEEAKQLWAGARVVYADEVRPTPVEKPIDAATRLTSVEPLGDGKFLIRAPWLGEGETVTGQERAEERRGEVIAEGVATYEATKEIGGEAAAAGAIGGDGFDLAEAGSNGWYEISGPGIATPERVRGKEKAEQRLAELRGQAAGPTDETGNGSDPA